MSARGLLEFALPVMTAVADDPNAIVGERGNEATKPRSETARTAQRR
jgi:hypothetical protein